MTWVMLESLRMSATAPIDREWLRGELKCQLHGIHVSTKKFAILSPRRKDWFTPKCFSKHFRVWKRQTAGSYALAEYKVSKGAAMAREAFICWDLGFCKLIENALLILGKTKLNVCLYVSTKFVAQVLRIDSDYCTWKLCIYKLLENNILSPADLQTLGNLVSSMDGPHFGARQIPPMSNEASSPEKAPWVIR